ncbi:hypothetical protein Q4Q39_14105 [Flavivirga amylovorans]|uniref:HTH luxR-type domain-containing protein n=1 Tax=Flavivirga amylovorans TaxID=870486 RepID=A0ABT8X3X0_9FLAO|nr:hypothetical protein [Flavivirga amylovorans]MDO5988542.1 hypothetical protein [Flavivirga amylovorans]
MLKKHIRTAIDFISNSLMETEEKVQITNPLYEFNEGNSNIPDLQRIESLINARILTQEDWKNFKKEFTKLYPLFFINLKLKNIQLTKSEERLLALEYLNLSTHEIAGKLGVSDRSVIVSRYRLRKKTKAPKGTPILEYLNLR